MKAVWQIMNAPSNTFCRLRIIPQKYILWLTTWRQNEQTSRNILRSVGRKSNGYGLSSHFFLQINWFFLNELVLSFFRRTWRYYSEILISNLQKSAGDPYAISAFFILILKRIFKFSATKKKIAPFFHKECIFDDYNNFRQ